MDYETIFKAFIADLKTMPKDNVVFYDIWDFRGYIEKIEKNMDALPSEAKLQYNDLLINLDSKLNDIRSFDKDPLVKKEAEWLRKYIKDHFEMAT